MRAYLRISPQAVENKLEDGYSAAQIGAWMMLLTQAEQQPDRGRFKNLAWLRAALGGLSRHIPLFLEQEDLVRLPDGRYYVTGWDEWQEGDWKVNERVRRVREARDSRHARNGLGNGDPANSVTAADVSPPLGGDRKAVGGRHKHLAVSPAQARAREAGPAGGEETLLRGCEELMGRTLSGAEVRAAERLAVEAPRLTADAALQRMAERKSWLEAEGKPPYRRLDLYVRAAIEEDHHLADQGVTRPRENGTTSGFAAIAAKSDPDPDQ